MISRAGTTRIAFQYIGLIPQIKNAEDAYATPDIVRDSRLGFVFWDLIDFIWFNGPGEDKHQDRWHWDNDTREWLPDIGPNLPFVAKNRSHSPIILRPTVLEINPTPKWFEEVYIYIRFVGTILQRDNRVNRLFNAVEKRFDFKIRIPYLS